MKGLFCFDGPIYRDKNGDYCSTIITDEVLRQFFDIADYLYLAIRVYELDDTWENKGFHKINTDKIKIVPCKNLISPKGYIFDRKKQKNDLDQYVKEADLIFLRLPSIISNIVRKSALKYKKKIFAEVVGCAWDSYWNHSLSGKIVAGPLFIQQKKSVRCADVALYVTSQFLQHRYKNTNISYGYSDVILPAYNEEIRKLRLKKIRSENKKIFVIGTTAAVNVRYKGQQYVIEALAELIKDGYEIRYEMVGGGSPEYLERAANKSGVSGNVKFMGTKRHDEVFSWLDTVDLYVQPSRQEGMPRALLEAMSRGCPAIGTVTGGIPELLAEEYLVKNGRPQELRQKISQIINNKYILEKMATENLNIVQNYQFERLYNMRKKAFSDYLRLVKENESKIISTENY